jgi:hypothetical protein
MPATSRAPAARRYDFQVDEVPSRERQSIREVMPKKRILHHSRDGILSGGTQCSCERVHIRNTELSRESDAVELQKRMPV